MAADATVVILDDLHSADEDTVSVLTYLAEWRSYRSHYYWQLAPNRCFRPGWNV